MRRGGGSGDARIPATPGDLAAFAVRAVSDQQLRVVLAFSGALDAERLGEATRLLTAAWPILGCRLVLGPRPHWAQGARPAAGGVVETTDPATALADVVASSCDPRTGPVFDVRLVRASGEEREGATDTVCLRVDHAACDGVGAKELAYALLGLYRALGEGSGARTCARVAAAWSPRRRSYLPILRAARVRDVARAAVLFPDHGARFRLPYDGRSRHEPRLAVARVDARRVARVRAYGSARGATLNDALLTAVFRALPAADSAAGAGAPQAGAAGAGPDAALRVLQMPIDLRPRQEIPAAELPPANLAGLTFPTVRVTPDEPFDDTLRRVTAATRLAKSDVAALHIPAAFSLLFLLLGTQRGLGFIARELRDGHADGRSTPVFTNFGGLDAARLRADRGVVLADAFVASPVIYPPALTVAASEFAGALTLSSGSCAAAIEPSAIDGLLQAVAGGLPAC